MNNTANFMKMFMLLQDMSTHIDDKVEAHIESNERNVFAKPGIIKQKT